MEKSARRWFAASRSLVRLLRRGASAEQVTRAAKDVRAARVRVLRSKRAQVTPSGDAAAAQLRRLDADIRRCEALAIETIITELFKRTS
jgi:hypothetical protein